MNEHGKRLEDIGLGRLIKFWPLIVAVFTAGAWYQNAKATNEVMSVLRRQNDEHEIRITRVEDAVIYLKDLVAIRRSETRH